jgi:AcrR family transcriptional regulator
LRSPTPEPGEKAIRTREHLVSKALELFLERGFGGTTIDHITDAAGVSRATFYSYFATKRDVLLAAGARALKSSWVALAAIRDIPHEWTRADLEAWVRLYLAFLDEYGGFTLMWSQAAWSDPELRRIGMKGSLRAARTVGETLNELRDDRSQAPEAEGLAIIAMLDRFWYVWKVTGAPFKEQEAVDALAGIVERLLVRTSST